jgi:hypothetical protein
MWLFLVLSEMLVGMVLRRRQRYRPAIPTSISTPIMSPTPRPSKIVERFVFGVVDCVASDVAFVVAAGDDTSSGSNGVGATKIVVRTVVIEATEGVVIAVSMNMVLERFGTAVTRFGFKLEGMVNLVDVRNSVYKVPESNVLSGDHTVWDSSGDFCKG